MMKCRRAFTLVELLTVLSVGSIVFGGVILSFISLQRTYSGSGRYAANMTAGSRLLDHLALDLRRALRINQGPLTTPNPLRGAGTTYVIGNSNILSITIPDYYASNSTSSTAFSTARYPFPGESNYVYATALTPWGQARYSDATKVINNKYTTAFVPPTTGSDELEVRYLRTTRALHDPTGTPNDPTVCIFRQEYKDGARVSTLSKEEIAEQIDFPMTAAGTGDLSAANNLSVTSQDAKGTSFLVQFAFASVLSASKATQNASVSGTGSTTVVVLRNPRRD